MLPTATASVGSYHPQTTTSTPTYGTVWLISNGTSWSVCTTDTTNPMVKHPEIGEGEEE